MTPLQEQTLLDFFRAVGQPDRARILGLLAGRAYTIPELAKLLDMKGPVVLTHINKLIKARLIRGDGYRTGFQLDNDLLQQLNDIVFEEAEPYPFVDQVLQKYVDGHRLKAIPDDRDERRVVLEWLAEDFKVGKRYTEANVDFKIQRHFHHTLTLRRYLLDSGLLLHASDIYWRPAPEKEGHDA